MGEIDHTTLSGTTLTAVHTKYSNFSSNTTTTLSQVDPYGLLTPELTGVMPGRFEVWLNWGEDLEKKLGSYGWELRERATAFVYNPEASLEMVVAESYDFVASGGLADTGAGLVDGFASSLNPFEEWLPVPKIGVVYGHTGAYAAGNIAGVVTGIATQMILGTVATGGGGLVACGSFLQRGVQLYSAIQTGVGMVSAGVHIAQGKAGIGDVLALAPALGYAAGKAGIATGILSKNCFVAGTMVVVADHGNGLYETKPIEVIEEGDFVLTRDQNSGGDPDAPLEYKRVKGRLSLDVGTLVRAYFDIEDDVFEKVIAFDRPEVIQVSEF